MQDYVDVEGNIMNSEGIKIRVRIFTTIGKGWGLGFQATLDLNDNKIKIQERGMRRIYQSHINRTLGITPSKRNITLTNNYK